MNQPEHGPPDRQMPQQRPPAAWSPPMTQPPPGVRVRVKRPARPLCPGHGWWTAAGVCAFIAAGLAASLLALLTLLLGTVGLMADAEGGSDGVHEVFGDARDSSVPSLMVMFAVVAVVGLVAGVRCVRRHPVGPWLGFVTGILLLTAPLIVRDASPGLTAPEIATAVGTIVCGGCALRHPQRAASSTSPSGRGGDGTGMTTSGPPYPPASGR